MVLNSSFADLQLRGADEKVHLLRPEGDRYREVTSQNGLAELSRIAEREPVHDDRPG